MKKLLALLLALTMVLSLAACGGKAEEPKADAPAADAPAAAPVVVGEIGSPDAPVTVKVVCKDVFPDEEDVRVTIAHAKDHIGAGIGQRTALTGTAGAFQRLPVEHCHMCPSRKRNFSCVQYTTPGFG